MLWNNCSPFFHVRNNQSPCSLVPTYEYIQGGRSKTDTHLKAFRIWWAIKVIKNRKLIEGSRLKLTIEPYQCGKTDCLSCSLHASKLKSRQFIYWLENCQNKEHYGKYNIRFDLKIHVLYTRSPHVEVNLYPIWTLMVKKQHNLTIARERNAPKKENKQTNINTINGRNKSFL